MAEIGWKCGIQEVAVVRKSDSNQAIDLRWEWGVTHDAVEWAEGIKAKNTATIRIVTRITPIVMALIQISSGLEDRAHI